MKKILLVILFLLLFPSIVLAKDTCNSNDIKIEEINVEEKEGYTEEVTPISIDNNKINLNLEMYNVGESITYKIKVKNNSNNDYYFTKDSFNLNTSYLEYSLLNESEVIKSNKEKEITLKITYKEKISEDEFNENNMMSITLSDTPLSNPSTKRTIFLILLVTFITIIVITINKNKKLSKVLIGLMLCFIPLSIKALCTTNLEINVNITINKKEATFLPGPEVNVKMKELAGDDTSTATPLPYYFQDENVIAIKYSNTEPVDSEKQEKNLVSIADSPYPIYMWYEEGTIYWWSEAKHPKLNEDSTSFFYDMRELNDIESLCSWDTSNVVKMDYMFFFTNLSILDNLESWNTSKVTTMRSMFHYTPIKNIKGIENWDVSNVTNMSWMFSICSNLEEINLSKWETSSLKYISHMFATSPDGASLKRIILSKKFDSSKVTDMSFAFYNLKNIQDYSFLQYLNTSNVRNMQAMFFDNYNLTSLEWIKNWDVSNVENMQSLFIGTVNLTSVEGLRNWNTSRSTNMSYMFRACTSLESLSGLENWDVSGVTDFTYMFGETQNLTNASSINNWNISSNATFTRMFINAPSHPEFSKVPGTWSVGTFTPTP